MVPWIITIFAVFLLVFAWLDGVKKQLKPLREAVQSAGRQVELYSDLLKGVSPGTEEEAYIQECLTGCMDIYKRQAHRYNETLRVWRVKPAARLLGYQEVAPRHRACETAKH